jgi:hypothetical protein
MGSELINAFILKLRRTDSSLFVGGERFLRKIFKWMKVVYIRGELVVYSVRIKCVNNIIKFVCVFE